MLSRMLRNRSWGESMFAKPTYNDGFWRVEIEMKRFEFFICSRDISWDFHGLSHDVMSCGRRITEQNDSDAAVVNQCRISRSRIAGTRRVPSGNKLPHGRHTDDTQTMHGRPEGPTAGTRRVPGGNNCRRYPKTGSPALYSLLPFLPPSTHELLYPATPPSLPYCLSPEPSF